MLANIFQLSAGILLGISSFIVKETFAVPVFGEKLPGSLERYKQGWLIRIGLILLIIGYALPILEWNPIIHESYLWRTTNSFLAVVVLVIFSFLISAFLAKRKYNKQPPLGKHGDGASPGMFAFEVIDNKTKK